MNKEELIDLLGEIAEKDLSDGSELSDHPCSLAIRTINKCISDISHLKKIIKGTANKRSKRSMELLGMSIDMRI